MMPDEVFGSLDTELERETDVARYDVNNDPGVQLLALGLKKDIEKLYTALVCFGSAVMEVTAESFHGLNPMFSEMSDTLADGVPRLKALAKELEPFVGHVELQDHDKELVSLFKVCITGSDSPRSPNFEPPRRGRR